MKKKNLPLLLLILDGWGIGKDGEGNAVKMAKTPNIDKLYKKYPYTRINASGKYVGLPDGQVGNSEAGHTNLGAGRVVKQDSLRINEAIVDQSFFRNSAFLQAIKHAKKRKSQLHLMGLLSNGSSPHSDTSHIISLLKMARENGIIDTKLHIFTDGRDSYQYEAVKLLGELEKHLKQKEEIVTVMGRFYAMDRKKKWERTEEAFYALTQGKKTNKEKNFLNAITKVYNQGVTDEFIDPFVINDKNLKKRVSAGDSVIFFNLRSDRARQLTKAFVQSDFNKMNPKAFKIKRPIKDLCFVVMTDFGPDLDSILTAFPERKIAGTLPIALKDISQIYISESEKYAHMTYFFNGGYPGKVNGEDHFVISSPNVKFYNKSPKMKTKELTDKTLDLLKKDKYDVVFMNFAAPDMIGHTGDIKAAITCCETVDENVGRLVKSYLKKKGTVIVTADHGNIEYLIDPETNMKNTKHTTNKVPFIIVNDQGGYNLKSTGNLGDVASTVLDIIGIKKDKHMKGKSLIKKK